MACVLSVSADVIPSGGVGALSALDGIAGTFTQD
jgi:TPP-dependent 2-oxoacid decarboxylase